MRKLLLVSLLVTVGCSAQPTVVPVRNLERPSDMSFVCMRVLQGTTVLTGRPLTDYLGDARIWDEDVTDLLPTLPDACLDRVYILYPDPWPKRRQRKRRLVSDETLKELARVMRPGAELRFASDIDNYIGWVLARVLRSADFRWTARGPDDWRRAYADWPGTRYDAKAIREGRVPSYLRLLRI